MKLPLILEVGVDLLQETSQISNENNENNSIENILDKMMFNYLPVAVQAVSKPPSIPSIEGFPARKVNMASSMGEGDGGFGPPPVPGYFV